MPQQRLWQAVEALAVSSGPIQDRLYSAGVALSALQPDDFEDADRAAFTCIMDALTSRAAIGDEGTLRATASNMGDEDAVAIAGRIFALDSAYRPLQ